MGAWIEILVKNEIGEHAYSRTPRWVRGLKFGNVDSKENVKSRTPRWVRGLKSNKLRFIHKNTSSHPTMGAWIEIPSQ